MKFLSSSLKRFTKKQLSLIAIITSVVVLLGIILFVAYRTFTNSVELSKNQTNPVQTAISKPAKKQVTQDTTQTDIAATQPTQSAPATPGNPAPTTTPKPVAPATPKPKTSKPSVETPCGKYIPIYYTDYTKNITTEANKHQSIIASIKQAYESNPYPGSDQVNAYYADTAAEKARYAQVSSTIYNNYKSTLASYGCYI